MDVKEIISKFVFLGAALLSVGITLGILGFMVLLAYPIFAQGLFWKMLIQPWSPDQGINALVRRPGLNQHLPEQPLGKDGIGQEDHKSQNAKGNTNT